MEDINIVVEGIIDIVSYEMLSTYFNSIKNSKSEDKFHLFLSRNQNIGTKEFLEIELLSVNSLLKKIVPKPKSSENPQSNNDDHFFIYFIKDNLHVKNNTMYNMVTNNKTKTLKESFLNYYRNSIYLKPNTKNSKPVTKEANKIILFNNISLITPNRKDTTSYDLVPIIKYDNDIYVPFTLDTLKTIIKKNKNIKNINLIFKTYDNKKNDKIFIMKITNMLEEKNNNKINYLNISLEYPEIEDCTIDDIFYYKLILEKRKQIINSTIDSLYLLHDIDIDKVLKNKNYFKQIKESLKKLIEIKENQKEFMIKLFKYLKKQKINPKDYLVFFNKTKNIKLTNFYKNNINNAKTNNNKLQKLLNEIIQNHLSITMMYSKEIKKVLLPNVSTTNVTTPNVTKQNVTTPNVTNNIIGISPENKSINPKKERIPLSLLFSKKSKHLLAKKT
jgi:hypothetical protein